MRDANRVSDEGGGHDQNVEERRDSGRSESGSQTVSRESRGGAAKEGTSSGNKSGGSGKKGGDEDSE